jgi:ATP-dependent DNA ligase
MELPTNFGKMEVLVNSPTRIPSSELWRTSPARSGRTPPAGFILPAQPMLVAKPPSDPDWTHEVKHDSFRLLARKEGERVTL